MLFVEWCLLLVVFVFVLFVVHCLCSVVCGLAFAIFLFVVRLVTFVVRCSWVVVYCSLFGVWRSLFVVCCWLCVVCCLLYVGWLLLFLVVVLCVARCLHSDVPWLVCVVVCCSSCVV